MSSSQNDDLQFDREDLQWLVQMMRTGIEKGDFYGMAQTCKLYLEQQDAQKTGAISHHYVQVLVVLGDAYTRLDEFDKAIKPLHDAESWYKSKVQYITDTRLMAECLDVQIKHVNAYLRGDQFYRQSDNEQIELRGKAQQTLRQVIKTCKDNSDLGRGHDVCLKAKLMQVRLVNHNESSMLDMKLFYDIFHQECRNLGKEDSRAYQESFIDLATAFEFYEQQDAAKETYEEARGMLERGSPEYAWVCYLIAENNRYEGRPEQQGNVELYQPGVDLVNRTSVDATTGQTQYNTYGPNHVNRLNFNYKMALAIYTDNLFRTKYRRRLDEAREMLVNLIDLDTTGRMQDKPQKLLDRLDGRFPAGSYDCSSESSGSTTPRAFVADDLEPATPVADRFHWPEH